MADAAYTARAATKAHVLEGIGKLSLVTENGRYSHDAAAGFLLGIRRVLVSTFCDGDVGHGMASLMRRSDDTHNPSKLSAIKSTDTANATTILASSTDEARARQQASASSNTTIIHQSTKIWHLISISSVTHAT